MDDHLLDRYPSPIVFNGLEQPLGRSVIGVYASPVLARTLGLFKAAEVWAAKSFTSPQDKGAALRKRPEMPPRTGGRSVNARMGDASASAMMKLESEGAMVLRRIPLLGVLLLLLLAVCGVALAAKTFTDPVGDVRGGAGPDVVAVTLSNTASTLTFRVRFASAPPLRLSTRGKWVDMLLIGIDVPPLGPPPTRPGGEWRGADFALGTHGPSKTGLLVRLGKNRSARPIRFRIVTRGRTLSFSIPRRALGSPRWFAFNVAAAREGESEASGGGFDVAPGHGTFRYRLR